MWGGRTLQGYWQFTGTARPAGSAQHHKHVPEDQFLILNSCKSRPVQNIISTNTKEVLNESSFADVELKTLIKVCSLDHLNVDSELDLFHAVARYAEAEQRRQGQNSPPVEGGPSSEDLCEKVFPSVESSSQSSTAAELDSKPPTEVVTSEPKTAEKENFKENLSIRAALQKIRFLSLTAAQFAEGPARSGLLTKDESFAVLMNIASEDSAVPMPTGFSECRERRQPRSDSHSDLQKNEQCFVPGSLEHTINALKCGDPSQVEDAARAAADMLSTPLDIQPALDCGILDALVPALTEGSVVCKEHAACAIYYLCGLASPAQLRVLAASAALQPYCRLLADWGCTCYLVLCGLTDLLQRGEQTATSDLLQQLRALGVPRLLMTVRGGGDRENSRLANDLLQTYFNNNQ